MNFKDFLKIFVITIFISLCIIIVLYVFFYLPVKNNKEIFPEDTSRLWPLQVSEEVKEKYGISYSDLDKYRKKYDNIYIIDGREIEEYNYFRFNESSIHMKAYDIENVDMILNAFNITEEEFNKSLIVIFCHDGNRSSEIAAKLNMDNIRFLIDGVEFFKEEMTFFRSQMFPNNISSHDFTLDVEEWQEISKNDDFVVINGRFKNDDGLFKNEILIRIGELTTEEYNSKELALSAYIGFQFIIIADNYGDLYYAKLLIYRLHKKYNIDIDDFHVVFANSQAFSDSLNKYYESK